MRSRVISRDNEMLVALRMSGFKGVYCSDAQELNAAFDAALLDKEIGMIILNEKDFRELEEKVLAVKEKKRSPFICTLPGRRGYSEKDFILKYVREAIGIKLE
ncbi:V-type ATP synthase subunit F [Aedoeadaptatus ivorii]|uniref:V-type ATP synthase subunit F n=1 Tax=Aedoeadaptatus ivorii TaxID=54006 RepID=A0A448UZQ5_9FIRM|nr:V-type ATP synthase subunit F [Peptoniphilus ivorii]MDQ0508520.1 V/A-type H+-transporting ATPase subunit F [Peptoniphilus ivorii]VEJ34334.1 V-type ATP synthase subunit F [Peptoniphilus ivorii]